MQAVPESPGESSKRAGKSQDETEPFYLSVRLTSKVRERLGELSWQTGIPWEEVAAALLEGVVPVKKNLQEFTTWRPSLPPTHPAFGEARSRTAQALKIPISKKLDRELHDYARARSKAALAAEWLQRCGQKSLSAVIEALQQLHQARQGALKAKDDVLRQLQHRTEFMALLIRKQT